MKPSVSSESELDHAKLRALVLALAINAAFAAAEATVGFASRSLALVSDAAHNTSDVIALGIALLAVKFSAKPPTRKLTYGFQRTEVLGAQVNSLLLVGAAALIGAEAIRRLLEPPPVPGLVVAVTAAIGVVVNASSAVVVVSGRRIDLNMKAAALNLLADVAFSTVTVISGVAISLWRIYRLDAALALLIALVMCLAAGRILWEVTHVLLEGAPRHIDVTEVEDFIRSQPAVTSVHHVHIWNLSSDNPALSGHVVLSGDVSLHEAQNERNRLSSLLAERFGIRHSTLEVECHPCEEQPSPASKAAE